MGRGPVAAGRPPWSSAGPRAATMPARLFPDMRVAAICHLRDPVSHHVPRVQQQVRAAARFGRPYDRGHRGVPPRWGTAFDRVVRPFDREAPTAGDVVREFAAARLLDGPAPDAPYRQREAEP